MSKVIKPFCDDNRTEDNAYGCSCICNVSSKNHDSGADAGSEGCGCTCVGKENGTANADLAYDNW